MVATGIGILAGFFAGIAEILIGHPFDTIKTRLQTQSRGAELGPSPFRGPFHCAVSSIRSEGLGGLYRGLAAPLFQSAIGVALLFGAMETLRGALGASLKAPHMLVLACCIIGFCESLLYCPLDHIKARLQVSRGGRRGPRTGVLKEVQSGAGAVEGQLAAVQRCGRDIIQHKGWLGLYQGWPLQLGKECTGNIALFATYDLILLLLNGSTEVPHGPRVAGRMHGHMPAGSEWLAVLPAGSLAGMAYYAASFPFDTVKSKVQTDSLVQPRYKNSLHCFQRTLREKGGWKELYKGLSLCLLRAIPGSAIQFIVFELVCGVLMRLKEMETLRPTNMDDHLNALHMLY